MMIREKFLPILQKFWNVLQLRILVLVSLFLQVVLMATGNRRKYTTRKFLALIIWASYLCADIVATLALGTLSKAEGKDADPVRYIITAFWAPFLLMHLGGPDTITAYSLADNELWARHLLGSVTQVGFAIYVLVRSWSSTPLNYLWMVVFVSGLVKYGERTWALFSASRDRFRELMVSKPDAGPNYAKLMVELVSKEQEGYEVSLGRAISDVPSSWSSGISDPAANVKDTEAGTRQEAEISDTANYFFQTFIKLFADLILSSGDRKNSRSFFMNVDVKWNKAFNIVEVELGLVYDLFYTKASLLYSWYGLCLRLLSCSSTIAAFVAFLIMNKNVYPKTEVMITIILLIGAISLEIYAIMILLSSDRMIIWLSGDWTNLPKFIRKFRKPIVSTIDAFVPLLRHLQIVPAKARWSNAIGQYNVLNYCLESKPKRPKFHQYLEKYFFWGRVSIPNGLKALIFDELGKRADNTDDKNLATCRSAKSLPEARDCFDGSDDVDFDHIVLLWHLATDFCYHTDVKKEDDEPGKKWLDKFIPNEKSSPADDLKFKREMSRLLSNYMMHLLIMSPFMLPSGIGQIRFQDTCAEATEFFKDEQQLSPKKACEMLLRVDTRFPPSKVKGDRSKSLLFDACRLAKSLQKWKAADRWNKITEAWLDILTYAAAQCRWNNHAEKLSQGGELLTHVWLLMAHFGMTNQFQISQGYIRAKLSLK